MQNQDEMKNLTRRWSMLSRIKEANNDMRAESNNLENLSDGISQVWFIVMIVLTALVGLWGFICILSGLAGSESILEVLKGYVTAITGT